MLSKLLLFFLLLVVSCGNLFADDPPRTLDPDLKIELFAEQPQIVTPTGLDVDHKGRIWAIESNTHFRPEEYTGHPSDRILVMEDTDGDNRADKIMSFTDGMTHTMSIAVKPVWLEGPESRAQSREKETNQTLNSQHSTLDIFVATRRDIFLFHDDDGDLKADRKQQIIRLETPGDYPHNGLAGFAFDAMGWMYFGFGENLGAEYKLIGSDGTTLSGGGEGGNLYRCRPDGSKLTRWATGFWNPHASCVDAFGRLFTVDNDPDSRPPCRLLHIIEGGDYGFRFRNGRKGLHPFTAWNGEIPGTLPMVSGTGEAPSGIVAYESDGLPERYLGNLLVTSWGDHRIDRFVLQPRGASFQSRPETIIQGDENFRPVGLALAPDGSLYCTDWVLKDYKLHGHGRVWRISAKQEPRREVIDAGTITGDLPVEELKTLLASSQLDVRRMAAQSLSETKNGRDTMIPLLRQSDLAKRNRVELLWSAAKVPTSEYQFHFTNRTQSPLKNWEFDEVASAAASLIRTAQFPYDSARDGLTVFESMHRERTAEGAKRFIMSVFSLLDPTDVLESRLMFKILFEGTDPFVWSTEVEWLSKTHFGEEDYIQWIKQKTTAGFPFIDEAEKSVTEKQKVGCLLAARRKYSQSSQIVSAGLSQIFSDVRRAAVQWVAEENLQELRPQVEAILHDKHITTDLFLATLAALEMLDGKSPKDFDRTPPSKHVLPLLKDADRPAAVRMQALRLVEPDDPALDAELFAGLLAAEDEALKLEAVRTLQHSPLKEAGELLVAVAENRDNSESLRAEAISGLYGKSFDDTADTQVAETLAELARSGNGSLQLEAVRASRRLLVKTAKGRATRTALLKMLRSAVEDNPDALRQPGRHRQIAEQFALALSQANIPLPEILQPVQNARPVEAADWYKQVLDSPGDAAAGRRIFFHADSAGCYKCHSINGRGENVGPDLSIIARTMDRKKLAESILEPGREIAPQFTNWSFVMRSGKVHQGMILGDTRDGIQQVGTSDGTVLELKASEIEFRQPQETSVMPEKLVDRLTVSELRDLLSFLETLK